MERITWRGTPGVGDFMMALNCAHNHAMQQNSKVNLEMHWEHDEDYYHHFEDPETIIERMQYIHNFYHDQDQVKVTHVFNSEEERYKDLSYWDDVKVNKKGDARVHTIQRPEKKRYWFESGAFTDDPGQSPPSNDWLFREDVVKNDLFRQPRTVVVWRATFNAEIPRGWKRMLTNDQWDSIISKLRREGLKVVELTYRTPIREVMFHIRTCRMVLCYDGMWHYIARNFCRAMGVVSSQGITKYHTPTAVRYSPHIDQEPNVHWYIEYIPDMLGDTKRQANIWLDKQKYIYGDMIYDRS